MHTIYLDFETRSACSLLTHGARRYARHASTSILCCSYHLNDTIYTWMPDWVCELAGLTSAPAPWEHGPARYVAHNSAFDRLIWQHVAVRQHGWPATALPDWACSAAAARANGLPGALAGACLALGLEAQKATEGKALIRKLSQPTKQSDQGEPVFCEEPEALTRMVAYCEQDVRAGETLMRHLRPLSPTEQQEYLAAERVNDRGFGIDVSFAQVAVAMGDEVRTELNLQLSTLTDGKVTTTSQYERIKRWITPRMSTLALDLATTPDGKFCLDKTVRQTLLTRATTEPELLAEPALKVIGIMQLANHNSVAKYAQMVNRHVQGRLYDAYVFGGAASTGRFSASGVQPHNLRRDSITDFDRTRQAMASGDCDHIIPTLATMLRPTIRAADGHQLHWVDWANVEGRACPWLAASLTGEQKLDMYREQDTDPNAPDVYTRMARRIGVGERQTGKIAELALQFGGGMGALQVMARAYEMDLTEDMGNRIIDAWRRANPWACTLWRDVKTAADRALRFPNTPFPVGRVTYEYTPDTHNGLGALWCTLPSGRALAYVDPKLVASPAPWDDAELIPEITAIKANWSPRAGAPTWPRYKLWYGVLVENITQAVCADLLRDAMVRAEQAGLRVVLHTHDEIVVESATDCQDTLMQVMQAAPDWAAGLPLAADYGCGRRYKAVS